MVALELTDIKTFMNQLLRSEMFDHFLLQEAVITGAATYVIDGHITKGYFSQEELEESQLSDYTILPFSMLRNQCFDLIKGKKTPISFKFVFSLSPENLAKTLSATHTGFTTNDVSAMSFNLKYQNQLLTLTTGISYKTFSVDHSLDTEWDRMVKQFLTKNEVSFEEM